MKNAGSLLVTLSTATTGATIRYTTDGSIPTTTSGTLINGSSGSTTITIVAGDTVTIKALAYKTGMTTSIVTTGKYYGPVPPPYTITSPKTGDIFHVGDSLHVIWTTRTGHEVRSDINISVDNGIFFQGILSASVYPTSPQWQNVAWKIPSALLSVSMVSDSCRIQVAEYGNYDQYAQSGLFSIKPRPTVVAEHTYAHNNPISNTRNNGMIRIPLDRYRTGMWAISIFTPNGLLVYHASGYSPVAEVVWEGIGANGCRARAGVYSVVIRQGETTRAIKVLLSR
jgi:hypothetical protein